MPFRGLEYPPKWHEGQNETWGSLADELAQEEEVAKGFEALERLHRVIFELEYTRVLLTRFMYKATAAHV